VEKKTTMLKQINKEYLISFNFVSVSMQEQLSQLEDGSK